MAPRSIKQRRGALQWPAWRHGPNGESEIFECEADVPNGWTEFAGQVYVVPEPEPELCEATAIDGLTRAGLKPDPTWGKAKLWEELEKVLGK